MNDATERSEELLRAARIRTDKVLRFVGETYDGETITWYAAYHGKFGWAAYRSPGECTDDPSDEDVKLAFEEYDRVELVDRSETPEEVTL